MLQPLADRVPGLEEEIGRLQPLANQLPGFGVEIRRLQPLADQVPGLEEKIRELQPLADKVPELEVEIGILVVFIVFDNPLVLQSTSFDDSSSIYQLSQSLHQSFKLIAAAAGFSLSMPKKSMIPPMELQAKTPLERRRLLRKLKEELIAGSAKRIPGYYLNMELLNAKGKKQIPFKWRKYVGPKPMYLSFEDILESLNIDMFEPKQRDEYSATPDHQTNATFMRKIADVYIFFHGGISDSVAEGLLEQRHHEASYNETKRIKVQQMKGQVSKIGTKLLTEVGVSILMFCLLEHEWLKADFETQAERRQYFEDVLMKNPLLIMLYIHYYMGSVYDLAFVYTTFKYTGSDVYLNDIKKAHQTMNRRVVARALDTIYMAFCNTKSNESKRLDLKTFRKWAGATFMNQTVDAIKKTKMTGGANISMMDCPARPVQEFLRDGGKIFKAPVSRLN
ncbi:hypothetical protein VTL71DRAFT_7744 [Oculimacula yallundae]|uniref:Uncharacterized protein n=1 Tax=Oculimacula yallundae TaxID=86028 RepID=A0ABR4CXR1_9HELO